MSVHVMSHLFVLPSKWGEAYKGWEGGSQFQKDSESIL